jgi:hypothetical protein
VNDCAILADDASLLDSNAAGALGAPGLAPLLAAFILPVWALLAPRQPGASTPVDRALIQGRALA